jgi:hypothetical protein
MVTGRPTANGVWVSDPWTGTHRDLTWDTFAANYENDMVVVE